jgi:hypothetical protein
MVATKVTKGDSAPWGREEEQTAGGGGGGRRDNGQGH